MGRVKYVRDSAAISDLLKSGPFAAATRALAESIAQQIPDATVEMVTTDRAHGIVGVPGGAAKQARDGIFTRAAAAAGTTVRSKR